MGPVIYNDGEIAVHYLDDEGSVGSIQRSFILKGKVVEQASKEQFLVDLPVCEEFLAEVKQDPESWEKVQKDLVDTLASRGIKSQCNGNVAVSSSWSRTSDFHSENRGSKSRCRYQLFITTLSSRWPRRLASHAGNEGSNPSRVAKM